MMNLKNRFTAGALAFIVTMSSLQFPTGTVRAEEQFQETQESDAVVEETRTEEEKVSESILNTEEDASKETETVAESIEMKETKDEADTNALKEESQETEITTGETETEKQEETSGAKVTEEAVWTEEATEESEEETETEQILKASDNITSGSYKDIRWVIDANGKLTVEGTGEISNLAGITRAPWCSHREKIKSAKINVTDMTDASYMFYQCSILENVDFSGSDISSITSMEKMFEQCSSLTNIDFSGSDISSVTKMDYMFSRCSSLTNVDFSESDISSVTNMYRMFYYCSSLTNVDFSESDISNANMANMFADCGSLTSVNFSGSDISNANMGSMFEGCGSLTSVDFSGINTSQVTNMGSMFRSCSSLTSIDLSDFDTSQVTNMGSMFSGCSGLTSIDVRGFDTSQVTNMGSMFSGCSGLTSIDVKGFDTSQVTNMGGLFSGCSGLTSIDVSNFDTNNVTDMGSMFRRCSSLTSIDVRGFDTSQVTNMEWMFWQCGNLTSIDLKGFDTSQVTSINRMFYECSGLTSIDVRGFDTSQVTNMGGLFYDCSNLTSVDVSGFDTSNVTDMGSMFDRCSNLASIDVSSFDTSNVTDMGGMFCFCKSLTSIDVSGFDTSKVTNMQDMFFYCYSLTSLDLSGFDLSQVIKMGDTMGDKISLTCTIYTPCNLNLSVPLYGDWYKMDGTKISELPQNLDYSILIKRYQAPSVTEPYVKVAKKKTIYACGDILNINDLTVRYYDTDGTAKKVMDYTINVDNIDMCVSGVKTLTVTYNGLSAKVKLKVNETQESSRKENVKISGITMSDSVYTGKPVSYSGVSVQSQNGIDITEHITLKYIYSGIMADNSPYTDTEQAPTNVGNYMMTVAVSKDDENYIGSRQYTFKITKASITITALDITLEIGSSLPAEYNYQVTGLLNDDALITAPSFDCYADMTRVGRYTIYPFGADAGMNYEIVSYVRGTLIVEGELHGSYEGITWGIDADGKLTVEGIGEISSLSGMDRAPWYPYRRNIISAEINVTGITDASCMFCGCYNLTDIDVSGFDTGKVTNMTSMFYGCSSLTSIDLSGIDTGKVTNMESMFRGCSSLMSIDVNDFDTSQVTNMGNMFSGCSGLTSIAVSVFDTENVTDMGHMFYGCNSLTSIDVSSFDTENVTDMGFMFYGCSGLTSIDFSGFDTSKVTNMVGMFEFCSSLTSIDVSGFDTENVTAMGWMFCFCSSLTSIDVSGFDTSKVTNMVGMFASCGSLSNVDVSGFDTENVTDMGQMFSRCSSLTSIDVSSFDTAEVTDMDYMFYGCSSLTSLDLSSFDVSKAEFKYSGMIMYCSQLTILYTPYNLNHSFWLSDDWYKADGTKISQLPQNLDYSILIMRDQVPSVTNSSVRVMKKKTVYECGDVLDVNDLTVRYYDTDGTVKMVTDYTTDADQVDMLTLGIKPLTVTYRGDTAEVPITIKDKETPIIISGIMVSDSVYTGKPFAYTGTAMVTTHTGADITTDISLTYTYTGTQADGSTYEASKTAPVNAGNYKLTIEVSKENSNYKGSAEYAFKITKVPMEITALDITLFTGESVPTTYEYQMKGLLNGDALVAEPSFTCNADMEKAGTYEIIPHDADAGMNYEIAYVNGTLTVVDKENVTISGLRISDSIYTGKVAAYSGSASVKSQDGTDITSSVTLTYSYSGKQADNSPYTDIGEAPVNAGEYILTVAVSEDNENYTGSAEYAFKITKAPIEIKASDITLAMGKPLPLDYKYQITGLLNGDILVTEPSFTCSADMTKTGTYEITPRDADAGMNYEIAYADGTLTVVDKEDVTISGLGISDSVYTGKAAAYSGNASVKSQDGTDITGSVTLTYSYSGTQADGSSYGPSETAPVNAGAYILTVAVSQDDAHYVGSTEYRFEITKAPITVTALDKAFETGEDTVLPTVYPYEVTGLLEGDKLTEEPSFTYTDMDGKEISGDSISLKEAGRYYVIPKEADAGTNYEISYQKGILTIKGTAGDLPDDDKDSEVLPEDIPQAGIPTGGIIWASAVEDQSYTGAAIKPDIRVYSDNKRLTEKADYTVAYKNNKQLGTADIIITGKGNYKDKKTVHFNIVQKDISDKDIIIEDMAYADDGKQHKAVPNVVYNGKKLKLGTDFTIEYGSGDYTTAGDYYATISGKGNYKGTYDKVKTTIIDKNMLLNKAKITKIPNQEYNKGEEITLPDSAIRVMLNGDTLTKDTDYTVDYVNNRNAGKAAVVIKGKGRYAGTKTIYFKIVRTPVNIAEANLSCDFNREVVFSKGGCMPVPKVSCNGEALRNGTDYTVSYKNNKACGTASLTVKGKGSFKGSRMFEFTIKQKELSAIDMRVPNIGYVNKAGRYQSNPILTDMDGNLLKSGTDYTVTGYTYDGRTLDKQDCPPEGAKITVTVQGKGSYNGTCTASYELKTGTSLSKAKITVADQSYTGISVKPEKGAITGAFIKINGGMENLVYGRDYEIAAYGSNIKKGSGTVVLRGLGNYYGEKTVKFKIVEKSVE